MLIGTAAKVLTEYRRENVSEMAYNLKEALTLGIEALARLEELRRARIEAATFPLSAESHPEPRP